MSTKILFPSPPPTTNDLTSHQRSQLLRTTHKLGRLLGTTPQLMEESMEPMIPLNLQRLAVPLHVGLSSVYTDDALERYPSSDTLVSSSSHDSSSLKRNSSLSSSSTHSTKSTESMNYAHAYEFWPKHDRPRLRISLKSPPKLDTIPQSPPPTSSPTEHTRYTLRPAASPRSPATSPSFVIPTTNTLRRQKMDRLRRTLGDGVPLDMVFPDEETEPVPFLQSSQSASTSDEDIPARTPRPQPASQRLTSARDSIISPTSPHHARRSRQFAAIQATRPAPPPPSPPAKRLSAIAENPSAATALPAIRISTDRASTPDSLWYEGDTEGGDSPKQWGHRRTSRLYTNTEARRIKRVPVPVA